MSDEIILYDIGRRGGNSSWSANVLKTRQALNYKKIPYRTEWVNHAIIAETLKDKVPKANPTGFPYTVPAMTLSNGKTTMGSFDVAEELERIQPAPPLHLDEALQAKIDALIPKIAMALAPIFMPRAARDIIVEESVPYFKDHRAKMFGMSLDQLEKTRGGEAAWKAAEPGLHELSAFLTENKNDDGPFVLGSQVTYVDFCVNELMEGLRLQGQDIFDRLVSYDPHFVKLHEACKSWAERIDH